MRVSDTPSASSTSATPSQPDTTQPVIPLNLNGSKGNVEIRNALGVTATVWLNGAKLRPAKGAWHIPLRGAAARTTGKQAPGTQTPHTGELRSKGYLPGFQRFEWQDQTVVTLGAHVGRPEKLAMFAPAILMIVSASVGALIPAVAAVAAMFVLFFMNISLAKNAAMPRVLRIILPIVNALAISFLLLLLAASFGK